VPGSREPAVALTKEGRSLLERHRDRGQDDRQTFWDGLKRERELEHDLQVYRACERQVERLAERAARIERVVLDHELKREYQTWLHERDRDRPDYDGHPDRTDEEIRAWAVEHDLPYTALASIERSSDRSICIGTTYGTREPVGRSRTAWTSGSSS
jgi:hypothetical protein